MPRSKATKERRRERRRNASAESETPVEQNVDIPKAVSTGKAGPVQQGSQVPPWPRKPLGLMLLVLALFQIVIGVLVALRTTHAPSLLVLSALFFQPLPLLVCAPIAMLIVQRLTHVRRMRILESLCVGAVVAIAVLEVSGLLAGAQTGSKNAALTTQDQVVTLFLSDVVAIAATLYVFPVLYKLLWMKPLPKK